MELPENAVMLMRIIAWAVVALIAVAMVVWWRLRDVIRRYRSIRLELDSLARSRDSASGQRKAAFDVVLESCDRVYRDPFPKAGSLLGLGDMVRKVASCYHPEAERPELGIRCGRLLLAVRRLSEQVSMILQTPGFNSIGRLRLRRIRAFYLRFQKFQQNPVVRAATRHSGTTSWVLRSRLLVFPDPLSWLAFLSHRLVVMSLLRCVVTDIYLAVGVLAVECYDGEDPETDGDGDETDQVSGLNWFYRNEFQFADPRILEIRRGLPGVTDSLSPAQWGRRWHRAVERAALILAADQFPAAADPLQEASLEAVIERLGSWLMALSGLERNPMIKAALGVKVETVLGLGDIATGDFAARIGKFVRSCSGAYGVVRLPVTAARWLAMGTPGRIAFEAGWTLAGRIVASYCLKYGFDLACREIDALYRKSRSEH